MELDSIVSYAIEIGIEKGIKLGIEAYKNEAKAKEKDPRILIVKSDAEKRAGGRMVLSSLEKRGFISPYQFGIEEMIDMDGDIVKESQGRIYYKLSELVKALEDGNILKGIRKKRNIV